MNTLFFWTSKLVWALIRPETVLILLLVAALWALWRNNLRLGRRLLFLAVISIVVIATLPLGTLLTTPLEARYPARPTLENVSAIVVLGGSEKLETTKRWGEPSLNAAGDVYFGALELARRFPHAKVYFAGGGGHLTGADVSEASIARSILTSAGLEPDRLLVEPTSRNTAENASNLRKLIGDKPSGTVVLITSAARMPRAMGTFCAAGWNDLVAWPTDFSNGRFEDDIGEWDFANNLGSLNGGVKEWIGLLAYRLTGRTTDLLSANCGGRRVSLSPNERRSGP